MPARPQKQNSGERPDPEDVRRLHAAGESRNGTARALGVSTRQVDAVAREIGVSWSADATRDAVETQRNNAEIERLELAAKFRRLALDSVDRALTEDDSAERRRLSATAEAAARSDLAIWTKTMEAPGNDPDPASADAIVEQLGIIIDTPMEVLDPEGEFESTPADVPVPAGGMSPHPEDAPGWK